MNLSELSKILYDFEDLHFDPIKEIKIDRWNLWRVIKTPLYYHIFTKKSSGAPASIKKTGVSSLLLKKINSTFRFLLHLIPAIIKRKKVILFPFDVEKTYKNEQGKYVNITMDIFADKRVLQSYLYMETSYLGNFKKPALIEGDLETDGLQTGIALLAKTLRIYDPYKKETEKIFSLLLEYKKNKALDFELELVTIKKWVYHFYAEFIFYKLFYLLTNPRAIIITDQLAAGKVAAAISNNIRTIELQHGLIDEYKPDYILNKKMDQIRDSLPLPEKIGVFGDYYKDILLRQAFWKPEEIIPLGTFRMDLYRNKISSIPPKNNRIISFPAQWNSFQELSDILTYILLNFKSAFTLYIKAHPQEPPENIEWYRKLAEQNKDVVKFFYSEYNIYEVIASSDLVIGFDSSMLLEAVALIKPVITITSKTSPRGVYSHIPSNNELRECIKLISNKDELSSLLNQYNDSPAFREQWEQLCRKQSEYICKSDYLNNCRDLISKVLQ